MTKGIQLVSLRCRQCNSDLTGGKEGVFLYCPQCGAGFEIIEEELHPVDVYFVTTVDQPAEFLPFWAFDAQLQLKNREAKSTLFGNPKGLIHFFEERGKLRFYVPGYVEGLEERNPRALNLTYRQPELRPVNRLPSIEGLAVSQNDARKIADYLLITSEVEQSDMLRRLEYILHLDNPFVIVIGF